MTTLASAPGEVLFHFVKKDQPVNDLIRTLYGQPGQITIEHFTATNSHLKNGWARTGQMVVITPPNSQQCSLWEAELAQAAVKVDEKLAMLSAEEARIMAENYQLLSNITSAGNAGVGATLVYFKSHVNNIEGILKQISDLYIKTYNKTGALSSQHFYAQRKMLFAKLDATLNTFVGHARMGFTFDQNHIKNSLGLNTKSIAHQWKRQPGPAASVPGFARNFDNVSKLTRTLKGAGYVGIALDVGNSAVSIHEACTIGSDQQCAKTSFKEGGRLTGSIAGGAGSGAATAYLTCNLLFGLESAGTSLLWCGIVAGSVGGYFGSQFFGGQGKDVGEIIYKTTVK